LDTNAAGALDPLQVILWDGAGGVADGVDFGDNGEMDAIANHGDALYQTVIDNRTAAAFSLRRVDPVFPVGAPSHGLPPLGAGTDFPGVSVFYETTIGAIGAWATPPVVNRDFPPANLDGLEIWGPEGPTVADSDTDRYSLFGEPGGVSIFNADGSTFLTQSALAAALVTFDPSLRPYENLIDIDALMVQDTTTVGVFDAGDSILFSLWSIMDGATGFAYWGDATYVWDFATGISYYDHGGHLWDNGWTISAFGEAWNVDALEALAKVPEPGSVALLGLGLAGLGLARRRKG
jgi:hypothetical protein